MTTVTTYPRAGFDRANALSRPDGTTESHEIDHGRIIHVWENAKTRSTGNGTADDTATLQAGIDATPEGGTFVIPHGRYKYSTLTATKPIRIKGMGYHAYPNAPFGHADWSDTSLVKGTVLVSTATSGASITMGGTSLEQRGYGLEDLVLLGPGSGSSTGIAIGDGTHGVTASDVRNVQVSNFPKGWAFDFVEDSTFVGLRSKGCATGLTLDTATNQNVFLNTEVQYSTITGIDVHDCNRVDFFGGLLQNCTGVGLSMGGTANSAQGFYSENPGITYAIKCASGAGNSGSHMFANWWMSTGDDDVYLNVPQCTLMHLRHGGSVYSVLLDTSANSTTLINIPGTVTDSSSLAMTQTISNELGNTKIVTPDLVAGTLSVGSILTVDETHIQNSTVDEWTWHDAAPALGGLQFGPTAPDVYLFRTGANQLTLGDDDTIRTGRAVHALLPSAASYSEGGQFYCTTDHQPIWSDGAGNWREADGTVH